MIRYILYQLTSCKKIKTDEDVSHDASKLNGFLYENPMISFIQACLQANKNIFGTRRMSDPL